MQDGARLANAARESRFPPASSWAPASPYQSGDSRARFSLTWRHIISPSSHSEESGLRESHASPTCFPPALLLYKTKVIRLKLESSQKWGSVFERGIRSWRHKCVSRIMPLVPQFFLESSELLIGRTGQRKLAVLQLT